MGIKNEADYNELEPGMIVEADQGDLGEEDLSKPKIVEVVKDAEGQPEKIVVQKGVVFQKQIEVPVDRIQAVEPSGKSDNNNGSNGKVIIAATEKETEELKPVGKEELVAVDDSSEDKTSLLEEVEESVPTAEGLRRMESRHQNELTNANPEDGKAAVDGAETEDELADKRAASNPLKIMGPGFLAGMAGNDASAVTSYSVDGAQNGYGHLWLLLLSTPLYHAVQYACASVGRVTQQGFASILLQHYGKIIAGLATLVLIVANLALISADLMAIGSGFELITGLKWIWWLVPVALFLWYVTVYHNFDTIKKIFLLMSLAFITYLVTAVQTGANWGEVLKNTFIPQIDLGFASISSAVALLGATISPYNIFWQVQGEKEEKRPGSTNQKKMRFAALDVGVGVFSGNLIAYAIIICTSATIFANHQQIATAADAARSLEPLLGAAAKYLFAIGLIGAGLIAIPVLLASTSFAVAGSFGLPAGLSKKPWQNEGFYLILTLALVIGLVIAFLGFDPIQLMFYANVLNGVLAPVLVVFLILVIRNRKIMGEWRTKWYTMLGLVLSAVIMFSATGLLFYGLLTGQGK